VGPTAGVEDVKGRKIFPLPVLELRPLGRRARNQSLYRLRTWNSEELVSLLLNRSTEINKGLY
jgi:hypothetical protein